MTADVALQGAAAAAAANAVPKTIGLVTIKCFTVRAASLLQYKIRPGIMSCRYLSGQGAIPNTR
jgi:hypothetical protein